MPGLPDNLREFDDADKTRELIYGNTMSALQKRFPVEDDEFRLEMHNPKYSGPQTFSLAQQKRALMTERQLKTPITATWRLIHKPTNEVLDEREDVVMNVPYYTGRGTFIHNGNEYTMVNQSRLKPGAYVRKRRTGEVETQFNVKPGTGRGFHVRLEPATGIFKIAVEQSNVPLVPLLKAMGVTDKDMIQAWGAELYESNLKKSDPKAVAKLYERFSGYKFNPAAGETEQQQFIKDNLEKFELDPDVMARTLGLQNTKGVTAQSLIRATQKMLNVSKGVEDQDDRDSTMFSNIYSVEDLLQERIDKDAGKLARTLLFKARRNRNLKGVPRGALDNYIYHPREGLMLGSGLAMPLEETNPLHVLEQSGRITKLGVGGIGSAEAITDEARNVNNSQFGFVDPIAGPEGTAIGIDVRSAYRTFKGNDRRLYGEFKDVGSGEMQYLPPEDVLNKVVAFPGEMGKPGNMAVAMVNGKVRKVPKSEVSLEVPSFAHLMSSHVNMNPLPTGVQPGRQFYGAKFWSQYLPLVKGEVPLVDSLTPDGKTTFTEHYGRRVGAFNSKVSGFVSKITDDKIVVTDDNGEQHETEIVKDFPFNRLTGISYFPAVKQGDKVNVGDMLAHSNFTDSKSGAINMGINLKTAVIPARGHSYEDAYVISESAANKLATERLYGFDQENRNGVEVGKNKFISAFPSLYTREQIENIDDKGVVKPGTILNQGDPVILATGPKLLTSADAQLGNLHKVLRSAFTNKAVVWESSHPGVVVDTVMTAGGARVNVKSTPPVQVSDKLSTRFGLKGVVGKIMRDDDMPRDPVTNEPYEMLLNPMGVLSRVAPNQLVEMALAKIAKKTGQQMRLPQLPPPEGWAAWATKELEKAGVSEASDIFDPQTGKTIKNIGDGYAYVSAFHHLGEKKLSHRGESGAYTIDEQPAKGSEGQAKRYSQMDINATLAHGATEVVKDAITIRGNKDEDYFKALRMGRPLPEPKVPFIYNKFLNTLKAGGINIREQGDMLSLLPMTDKDVASMSKGRIDSSDMIDSAFEPLTGGLFDMGKTGGMAGNRWTHVDLAEPLPNPVMEEPIRRVLGLTVKGLRGIVNGTEQLNGKTGGAALKEALSNIDIDKEIDTQKENIRRLRGANRDNAVKVVGYLSAVKKQGIHPSDWVISKVPVLPPVFRPIARLGDAALKTDMNEMYRDLIEVNKSIKDLRNDIPESELAEEKMNLYDAVTAAYGLGEPITPEGQSRRVKGAIQQVIGTSPKFGMFQSRVISKTVGGVGRGVVTPDPNLDMDSIGIPTDSAWTLYKDFVMRRMVRSGIPPLRATELIDKRSPEAKEMLDAEMQTRPVLVNRAPTWHKFNLLAFYPHTVDGHAIRVSPLITKGFTMDFDGDQANFHVPISDKAVDQAQRKMLPSKNLFSLTDLRSIRHSPSMEMSMGLYWLTREPSKKPPITFASVAEAKKAFKEGKISANDPIIIP
jgi:DNA-directed RNA polymerase beta subunit